MEVEKTNENYSSLERKVSLFLDYACSYITDATRTSGTPNDKNYLFPVSNPDCFYRLVNLLFSYIIRENNVSFKCLFYFNIHLISLT